MAKKDCFAGILVMVLVFGMTVVGCKKNDSTALKVDGAAVLQDYRLAKGSFTVLVCLDVDEMDATYYKMGTIEDGVAHFSVTAPEKFKKPNDFDGVSYFDPDELKIAMIGLAADNSTDYTGWTTLRLYSPGRDELIRGIYYANMDGKVNFGFGVRNVKEGWNFVGYREVYTSLEELYSKEFVWHIGNIP